MHSCSVDLIWLSIYYYISQYLADDIMSRKLQMMLALVSYDEFDTLCIIVVYLMNLILCVS